MLPGRRFALKTMGLGVVASATGFAALDDGVASAAEPSLLRIDGSRQIRFWLPGRLVVAGFRSGLEKMLSPAGGTEGSNPSPSTGESRVRTGDIGNGTYLRHG